MNPQEIESLSFQIIDREAGPHGFDAAEWEIVRRMIHTSADFDYMKTVRFHPLAIARGLAAIRAGNPVITDTEMARSGIRKASVEAFGGSVTCLIGQADVRMYAEKAGITRAKAAVDMALPLMTDGIYVIGNAPTALLRLMEQIRAGQARPALVIGLPVGFVNASESKSELAQMDVPHITNLGRKGGSNVAAAVVNALLIMAGRTS
ncbi:MULTISPECIES: precorrin-8X methylmutase [Desulfococcus]|jgi:precorrin-8X/cobalt-precorrin-8 methylmutase|uniref:Precorrin-8X methylmutase CbiC/CobH n=1 Tax=Desulfococcus multivorans DSM 2059 TaxID=1121405 RepID=S7TGS7_DESML|nr:precorrin-8X methylmutase [Desulfococcus multivorans]AOY59794.1 CbiC: precorrin-8X methylmutase [Desulfococcus multivorans]AQV01962.1 precorrin-8X methylmutase [Desulfococcus multivorans]EPR35795.1 Precorrin-8X methylmutase CbiC/CobH [Desulfococcus multivorans DSM 2059]MDX9819845.1 precorrin-8X methylmutase [Desulfococcus multivorans]SJZ33322.1 precorrin-8X methylmutase [Desulfococcus multivorans DSM 2059]